MIQENKYEGGFIGIKIQNAARKIVKKIEGIDNLRMLTNGEGPHVPNTNYCGPDTNQKEADKYGPTNAVDSVCKAHDKDYEKIGKIPFGEHRADLTRAADIKMDKALDKLPPSKTKTFVKTAMKAKTLAEDIKTELDGKKYRYFPTPSEPMPPLSAPPKHQIKPHPLPKEGDYEQDAVVDVDDYLDEDKFHDAEEFGGSILKHNRRVIKNFMRGAGVNLFKAELTREEVEDALEKEFGTLPPGLLEDLQKDHKLLYDLQDGRLKPEKYAKTVKRADVAKAVDKLSEYRRELDDIKETIIDKLPIVHNKLVTDSRTKVFKEYLEKIGMKDAKSSKINAHKAIIQKQYDEYIAQTRRVESLITNKSSTIVNLDKEISSRKKTSKIVDDTINAELDSISSGIENIKASSTIPLTPDEKTTKARTDLARIKGEMEKSMKDISTPKSKGAAKELIQTGTKLKIHYPISDDDDDDDYSLFGRFHRTAAKKNQKK